MTDATILITGATGQLGSLAIDALLETEDASRIAALVRPKDDSSDPRVERLAHLERFLVGLNRKGLNEPASAGVVWGL
ncbi:MAG: SDR family oxidoreductase [Thiohalocapsa sp.]